MLIMTLAESDGHSSRLLSSEGVDGASLLLLASYCHVLALRVKLEEETDGKREEKKNSRIETLTKL